MSPLKVCLLMRCYAYPDPNGDLPAEQAFAPAMRQAVEDFHSAGLLHPEANVHQLYAPGHPFTGRISEEFLTPRGRELVQRLVAIEPEQV